MLLTPRTFELARNRDKNSSELGSPFLRLLPSPSEDVKQRQHIQKMLLVHQTGTVKVGEIVRYTLTYEPSADRIVPSPSHLHVRIKNTSAIPLRAAYLHGPFALHVAAYPATFNPNLKLQNARRDGIPQFEPNLKAGGAWSARLTVPEDVRIKSQSQANSLSQNPQNRIVTWIIEVTSQILFSNSASVKFELLVARDERSLDYSFAVVPTRRSEPGQVHDHQQGVHGKHKRGSHSAQPKGVYSKAITMVVDDTESLWDKPALPVWEPGPEPIRKSGDTRRSKSIDIHRPRSKKKKKIHLVILTHGLHGNLGADMLFVKESIDATARAARENSRKRKEASKAAEKTKLAEQLGDSGLAPPQDTKLSPPGQQKDDPTTAPLSGGQEDLRDGDKVDDSNDDEEEIVIRGFNGNAVKTESGIQYLGKRLAKYILNLTYPDQPFKPQKKRSMTQKLSSSMIFGTKQDPMTGVPSHEGSTIRKESTESNDLAYTFTSISFIGHSLGGLVQLYAIAYIQKHAPRFFEQIQPVNFVAMASPLLGLSNENPMYVKFALDFGLVGRTGQDLGLTWRTPTLAKSGWTAMVGGFGSGAKDQTPEDPGAKPLLRILPTGPAHLVLRKFRNRTVYSNVVNDGIVPLRTGCLLFLDWSGLGKVEKARRENGLVGTVIGWGWAEMTGQSSAPSQANLFEGENSDSDNEPENGLEHQQTVVPQPADNAINDDETQSIKSLRSSQYPDTKKGTRSRTTSDGSESMGTLDTLWNFIRPSGKTTKTDLKMFKRSQTIKLASEANEESLHDESEHPSSPGSDNPPRALATRGSTVEQSDSSSAPPKTTIFESAANILSPPIPPTSWIIDPSSRARTIFHDRVYHPEDIPPPPFRRPTRLPRTATSESMGSSSSTERPESSSSMRVEEKIARAYHRDLSWRKVLVRLEPDAHNNMIVRRMFANAYGWPVVKHLCDTHFGDTYAATTRDENEPATDRAKSIEIPVGERGEHVAGQESRKAPELPEEMMRHTSSELKPLREEGEEGLQKRMATEDSIDVSDSYLEDTSDDERADARTRFQKLWSTAAPKSPSSAAAGKAPASPSSANAQGAEPVGTVDAEIADFLTSEPASMDGTKTPVGPVRATTDVGLKKSVEDMLAVRNAGEERAKTTDAAAEDMK